MSKGRNESQDITTRVGYNIAANLSEVEQSKIDADYLEEHFRQMIPKLIGDLDDIEKDLVIKDFENQLATLSQEHQNYAKTIIEDIRNGVIGVPEKTLRELIAEYQEANQEKALVEFSDKFSLDLILLRDAYHGTGNQDIIIEKLIGSCDKEKVLGIYGGVWLKARATLNAEIRRFIGEYN